jgi:p-cumate 2,3-dioxygenase beta subunit
MTALSEQTVIPPGWTRTAVEELLFREAQLLDEWKLLEWLALFTADARYVVPTNDRPDGDPRHELVLIDDDIRRMTARVDRLMSRKAHREYPHAQTSHQTTNVQLLGMEGDELVVRAAFTIWRHRNTRADHYVGHYVYRLRLVEGEPRINGKRAVMSMTSLRPAGAVSIIL